MQFFLPRCCLTSLVLILLPTDLPSRCLPSATGHTSSLGQLVSLVLGYAFGRILWPLFSAPAPHSVSTEISVAHHLDPQLKQLLCFSVLYCFSNGWEPEETVDSPLCTLMPFPEVAGFRKGSSQREEIQACHGASQLFLLHLQHFCYRNLPCSITKT